MKLQVLSCGHFPSIEETKKKLWVFLRSCEKFGIDPLFYGDSRPFPGYRQLMLDMQLDSLENIHRARPEITHILFTDAWDAFFCAGLDEIEGKYRDYGSPPILASAYIGLGNESDMSKYVGCFDESIPYRYPNRGGYIAEIEAIIGAFESMLMNTDLTGDDCMEWYRGWREGWFRPKLDSECQIFQVSDVNAKVSIPAPELELIDDAKYPRRLINTVTGSQPCILHLSGGYTDQVTGKDRVMVPWARSLGIL